MLLHGCEETSTVATAGSGGEEVGPSRDNTVDFRNTIEYYIGDFNDNDGDGIIEFFYIGDYNNINAHCCIGGTSVRDNIDMHMQAEHLVVGAPGRVFDMVPRRAAPCGDYATVGSGGGPHAPLLLNMTYVRCYQSVDRH